MEIADRHLLVCWQGTLHPRTKVVYRGHCRAVADWAPSLPVKQRTCLGLRAVALQVSALQYGPLRLVVTRNRHGNYESLVSNDLTADLTTMVRRKRSRWCIETIFRESKHFAGVEACQCRTDPATVHHVALVYLFIVLQVLRRDSAETVGAVKERWQLAVTQAGESPPPPLTAAPPHLRATT